MRDYRLELAESEQRPIYSTGNYVRVRESTGPVKIETPAGASLVLREGEAARIEPFDELRVTNQHAGNQSVDVTVGRGAIESARGVVTVDSVPATVWPKFTLKSQGTAATGNKCAMLLNNPPTSGKDYFIDRMEIGLGAGNDSYSLYRAPASASLTDGQDMSVYRSTLITSFDFGDDYTTAYVDQQGGTWNAFDNATDVYSGADGVHSQIHLTDVDANGQAWRDFEPRPFILREGEKLVFLNRTSDAGATWFLRYEERDA